MVAENNCIFQLNYYFSVRKDARKFARVRDLLLMNEELKKARKAFDEVKYAGTVAQ